MQTRFTTGQLADPDVQSADAILRRCVHCGFCNATCPTYQLTGDELDGPRGRIYLIKGLLEDNGDSSPDVTQHLDRCLSCLSCMTTCPSGVNYMHLIDQARPRIARNSGRGRFADAGRGLLAWLLPRAARMRGLFPIARKLLELVPLPAGLRPLRELMRTVPTAATESLVERYPATGSRRGTVALLAGCVQQVFGNEINHATVRLINRAGFDVEVLRNGCCGAVAHHLGDRESALRQARENVAHWAGRAPAWQAIIANASGCGTMLKDYAHLLRADAAAGASVTALAPLFRDVCEFLAQDGALPAAGDAHRSLKIISHTPCSLRHGQRVIGAPRELLRRAGFTVTDAPDDGICCGSAGTYNLLQPGLAGQLGRNKAAVLEAAGADIVASGNLGCMMQMARFMSLPMVHTVQLLDWAGGGPQPAAIGGSQVLKQPGG
ncbi:MAG: glycolate oxidase subunit GlcF [Gammaproteobacteria bacterium]|nr:glycolate oxidase subunit GlcF [Gammaproteobacteria bacterium]